jgi:hypothetical protein
MRDQSNATLLRENKKPSVAPTTESTQKVFYAAILEGSGAPQTYISFYSLSTTAARKSSLSRTYLKNDGLPKYSCHARRFLAGIQNSGLPIETFGSDNIFFRWLLVVYTA